MMNKELFTTLNRFKYVYRNTAHGADVNPCIFEDLQDVIEQINDLYAQCTMDENEYYTYQLKKQQIDEEFMNKFCKMYSDKYTEKPM